MYSIVILKTHVVCVCLSQYEIIELQVRPSSVGQSKSSCIINIFHVYYPYIK